MENIDIKIYKILNTDVKDLQVLGKQTFFETFAWGNTKENMENYLATNFSYMKLQNEINNPESEFYIAKLNNNAIGYLKVNYRQAQTELQNHNALEVERIYVLKEYHGKKVGQLLFEKALQIAKDREASYLWLGVWEKNSKAIKFYQKNGFIEFDKHTFKLGEDQQTDIIMKFEIKNDDPLTDKGS